MIGEGGERFQSLLSEFVIEKDCFESTETQAGVDVSYAGGTASAACVVMENNRVVHERTWKGDVTYPYIPSLFSLREFPIIYRVLKDVQYDILFVHGHGRAHPRLFGLACHTGLYFKRATIGVAGKRLMGDYDKTFERWTYLYYGGVPVGAVLRTHEKMNPIFVSVGHMVSLETAIALTFASVRTHKFPEVLRAAHDLSRDRLTL